MKHVPMSIIIVFTLKAGSVNKDHENILTRKSTAELMLSALKIVAVRMTRINIPSILNVSVKDGINFILSMFFEVGSAPFKMSGIK